MESMILGSPPGSPMASPSPSQQPPSSSTPFTLFPRYLMDGVQSPGSSNRVAVGSTSPGRVQRQRSSSTSVPSPGSPQPTQRDPFVATNRRGAPPAVGLMTTLTNSPGIKHSTPFIDNQRILGNTSQSSCASPCLLQIHNSSFNVASPVSQMFTPTKDNSQYVASESFLTPSCSDDIEDTWITVFGFPVGSASYILTQFAQLGTIVEQKNAGSGNWMHLKYQTKLQAKKALSKNGKIYGSNIMVGVLPYNAKQNIVEKENSYCMDKSMSMSSPLNRSASANPKSYIRPLTQVYQKAHTETQVVPTATTPKKADGYLAKTMQNIFGL